jgi:hypothetical protein
VKPVPANFSDFHKNQPVFDRNFNPCSPSSEEGLFHMETALAPQTVQDIFSVQVLKQQYKS